MCWHLLNVKLKSSSREKVTKYQNKEKPNGSNRRGMSPNLDDVVRLVTQITLETPQITVRILIDELYSKSATLGLTSTQIKWLIRFLCESPALSTSTKIFIIDKCLMPNCYISRDVVKEIARHLGTATAISEFKLQTEEKIQVALCKWLVNVHFLVMPESSGHYRTSESSVWIHLWQFGYLQQWLTYLLIWSSTTVADVKRWKITLLERVGSKPGYKHGAAHATLVLSHYQNLVGNSKFISDSIQHLNCNARKLRTLQELKVDHDFLQKLTKILVNESAFNFSAEMVEELVKSHFAQLQITEKSTRSKMSWRAASIGKVELQEIRSAHQLVWYWGKILEPKDLEPYLLAKDSLPQMLYLFQSANHAKFQSMAYDWIQINLKRILRQEAQDFATAKIILDGIVRFCQISDSIIGYLIEKFLNLKYLAGNPNAFAYLWERIFSLGINKDFNLAKYERQILQVLAYCHLNRRAKKKAFSKLCHSIIVLIRDLRFQESDKNSEAAIMIIQLILALLSTRFSNIFENRDRTILIAKILHTLPQLEGGIKVILPSVLNRFFIGDDPLLLDASCLYLIESKKSLLELGPDNRFVKHQNQFIMDLTNYLWRNKIFSSKKFLTIPVEFLRSVIQNLYLPDIELKIKSVFSVTGITALSYTSILKLRELEGKNHVTKKYTGLLTEDGFKNFALKCLRKEDWIGTVKNLSDMKIEILRELYISGPYNHVSIFLFTYLKSLSKFNTNGDNTIND